MWLSGDHYKWRCMRTFGIDEKYITGDASYHYKYTAFGIKRPFKACANLYPFSLSVGMLTDSRSFISYPRHELYRRVLCNYIGEMVERGEYFSSEENLKEIIENVCIRNTNAFFGFGVENI